MKKHVHVSVEPALHTYNGKDLVRCDVCGFLFLRPTQGAKT